MKSYEYNLFLIQSLKKGKEDAYVYLVNTYHKSLYGYVLSLCSDHQMAQDIIQSVFIRTWEFRKKLNPKYSIKSFLFKTAYNEFINQYWKTTSIKELETEFFAAINEVVEESEDTIEQLMAFVKKEIQNLPPKCKKIFLLSKQEGLTNHEISEHLNLSKRTVETQISKAYKLIRERVGEKINPIILLLLLGNRNYSYVTP